jgi:hypothetical protein
MKIAAGLAAVAICIAAAGGNAGGPPINCPTTQRSEEPALKEFDFYLSGLQI